MAPNRPICLLARRFAAGPFVCLLEQQTFGKLSCLFDKMDRGRAFLRCWLELTQLNSTQLNLTVIVVCETKKQVQGGAEFATMLQKHTTSKVSLSLVVEETRGFFGQVWQINRNRGKTKRNKTKVLFMYAKECSMGARVWNRWNRRSSSFGDTRGPPIEQAHYYRHRPEY